MKQYLYALVNLSPASLFTLLRNPGAGKELLLQNGKSFRCLNRFGLPSIPLQNLFPHNQHLEIEYFTTPDEFTYLHEIFVLCGLIRNLKPRTLFEIGTFHGYTTAHFALNTSPDAKIYTLDLPAETDPQKFQQKEGFWSTDVKVMEHRKKCNHIKTHSLEKRVEFLYGDSMQFDFSPYTGRMDFVFIDGAHSCDYVKSDSENAYKLLSENGVIVWHDYGETGKGISVNRAVDEFAVKYSNTYHFSETRLAIHFKNPPKHIFDPVYFKKSAANPRIF
jgi:predicted O-methyltransferase YrrM